ncbi:VOC family protein, partial [Chloroflexota bacterium]
FEVGDVVAVYQTLKNSDVNILDGIRTEEWGEKHFIIEDPNGMKIDIFQETEPTEEYRI